MRVCPAQRGGRTAHITLYAPGGGVLTNGAYPGGVAAALRCFLVGLPLFEARRRQSAPCHFAYRQSPDPVPVSITKVITGPWGSGEPVGVPEQCRIEMYWQTMPGETQDAIEREFFEWFHTLVAASPQVFTPLPTVEFPIRWMPGSSLSQHHPLVASFVATTGRVLGKTPVVEGIEGPCDLFVFHEFGIPSVLWGPIGGNTHAADEYVELESLEDAAAALLVFLCDWCDHSPQPSR